MTAYTLYYYIPWPDSQYWMDREDLQDTPYVVVSDDSCFVDKDVVDNRNGL